MLSQTRAQLERDILFPDINNKKIVFRDAILIKMAFFYVNFNGDGGGVIGIKKKRGINNM